MGNNRPRESSRPWGKERILGECTTKGGGAVRGAHTR